ncbi:MAG TPA: DUF1890 domain-containing protein [Methanomicrobia archaeon]|nr:DUF1890 domain-containing protein [Methanomicrobia archaeon]
MRKKALILLGCPELPIQTGIALYLASRLKDAGLAVSVAGTPTALQLLTVSDPHGHYVDKKHLHDLDSCIKALVEKRIAIDWCAVFVHNDAGVSYLATVHHISPAKLVAIVLGHDAEALAAEIDCECEKLVAKAVHNPQLPKQLIDALLEDTERWAALN